METNLPERSAEAPGRKDRPSHRDIGPAAAVGPETATGQDSDRNPRTAVRLPNHWNVTQAEATETYPADRLARTPVRSLTRGIDIDAPPPVVFRWLCQLKVAPYSYDWIDNWGRTSPRTLTPGADALAVGQRYLIAEVTDFAENEHITGRAIPAAERLFGVVAITYMVSARAPSGSRLVVRLVLHEPASGWEWLRFRLLAWGDLIMMRKQLKTLWELAEQSALNEQSVGP